MKTKTLWYWVKRRSIAQGILFRCSFTIKLMYDRTRAIQLPWAILPSAHLSASVFQGQASSMRLAKWTQGLPCLSRLCVPILRWRSLCCCTLHLVLSQAFIIIIVCLHGVFVAVLQLSLVLVSQGYSLVAVWGLLTVVVSPVVEHRLCGTAAAVVAVDGPGCPAACGIFLDQGLKPCPLLWQADS